MTSSVGVAARAERAAAAREAQGTAAEDKATGGRTEHIRTWPRRPSCSPRPSSTSSTSSSRGGRARSGIGPKGRTDRVDIATELQGELNLWIADWPEWESLLDSVERNDPSLIAVRPHVPVAVRAGPRPSMPRRPAKPARAPADPERTTAVIDDEEEGLTPEPVELQERPFPTRSEHFHARFRDTTLRFEALIREKCAPGCRDAAGGRRRPDPQQARPGAEDVLPALDLDANPRLGSWIDQHIREADRKYLKQALRRSVNPTNPGLRNWLIKDSLKAVHLAGDGAPDEDRAREIDRLFPLPMPDGGRIGRIFAWDPDIFRRFGDDPSLGNSRHFIHVLGCLHNLVESGNLHIQSHHRSFLAGGPPSARTRAEWIEEATGDLRPRAMSNGPRDVPIPIHPPGQRPTPQPTGARSCRETSRLRSPMSSPSRS